MASAGERVSDIYELLEMILYNLPTRDLLLSQRVSKQWKGVIENSKKLQQALFITPTTDDRYDFRVPTDRELHTTTTWRVLIVEKVVECKEEDEGEEEGQNEGEIEEEDGDESEDD